MAQNKLKQKVESLTRVVQQLIKEIQHNASLAQGTLTAFQLHIGEKEWEKIVDELKNIEERKHAAAAGINSKESEKKLEL
jgi:adenosine deaminase|tara:strand:- start:221 stop:460 length:240 start_codon:yes stop_codon:yes gene_type:complete